MSTGVTKSGDQIIVGDFVGSCAESPNRAYTIGWYCAKSWGRMDDKNYVLLNGAAPIVWGEVAARIYEGKVSDVGRFALHLLGKTNQSTVRFFEPNGQEFGSKQFRDGLLFFDLSSDGRWFFWNSRDELRAVDLSTMEQIFEFHVEPRFYATGAQFDCDGETVLLQHSKKGWYRFARNGQFVDKEKWLGDYIQDCDGASLYQTISELYQKQGATGEDEARSYAQWIEEALRRGIKDSYHLKISTVYQFLARLYSVAGEQEKEAQAVASAEQNLDGFSLVDRALSRLKEVGDPPNQELARQLVMDLDRATETQRLLEYPNYMGKLYRTKGELLELLGDADGAIAAFQKALEANPQAGCKKQLEQLTKAPVVLPEKPKQKPIEERISLDELTMFHFRCPACGATPKEVRMLEYLAKWNHADVGRLERLLFVLSEATKELKVSKANSTKRFLAAAEDLLAVLPEKTKSSPPGQPALLILAAEKTMVIQMECPVCERPAGLRRKDNYFSVWSEACRVQSSNLFLELGAILMGISRTPPAWLGPEMNHLCTAISAKTFEAGQAIGLPSCPRCGRFTSCIYGGSRSNPEKGTCRWCLDTSGANQITITVDLSDIGRAVT